MRGFGLGLHDISPGIQNNAGFWMKKCWKPHKRMSRTFKLHIYSQSNMKAKNS